ncbi:BatD family protein [Halosquirtibacter xylanolyticus]|uniref:BatD family protein n=1 Tax=Halosquirtibacter xylanolyticus TaxID=3374599 RepID=UPI003749EF87|nr:BatD family protein [Prolixibacteraceae bacterium]
MIAKKISFFLLLIFTSWNVFADRVNVKLSTPNVARVGQQIRLAIESNEQAEKVNLPSMSNFEVMMGPMTSSSSSVQIINGKSSRSNSYSYTYILKPLNSGTFVFPAIDVVIDGRHYKTKQKKIQIVKGNANTNTTSSGAEISKKDMFVKVLLSRTNVKEGEAILATTKLYTRLPISGVSNIEIPSFTNFYTKSVGEIRRLSLNQEAYDGDIYNTAILNKTLLFPQKDGTLRIDPAKITVQVRQRIQNSQAFFDDFFNSTRTVSVDVASAPRTVRVNALPSPPDSYSGAVGRFNIKASISETKVKANDAITLRLTIKGKGNLSLVTAPKLDFPQDFETYDPQSKNNIKVTESGEQGSKTLEYLIQPRFAGDYTIPSVSFAYYDPLKDRYVTQQTTPFNIHVTPGEGKNATSAQVSSFSKEDVKTVGKDIRFISTDKITFKKHHRLYGTVTFYMLFIGGFFIFIVIYLMNLKKIKEREDIWGTKNKKANSLALKRLKKASQHLKNDENELFYEAVLEALMGYLEDKLTLPKSELTKETIKTKLAEKRMDNVSIDALLSLIDTCEFARYAPSQDHSAQEELYKKAIEVLSLVEKKIKK